ncbi:MAG TPA: alpha-L-fucosidase [Acidimicrobiales bacterium]|nr:alpha-L-fucosidase [Acidimicrobiales bacterium]
MAFRNPTLKRLRQHRIPAWWQDAKLGIFVHWTLASVPAFAPVGTDFSSLLESDQRDAYSLSPYVEWYQNSLRFPDSPVARHHRETYGSRSYESFRVEWEAGLEHWDPEDWARKFKSSGARHIVLVAKHADGYCLWPTEIPNPHRPGWHSSRDVVGELAEAVRGQGMRFGLYYSGGMDWTFDQRPVGSMSGVVASIPRGEYPTYADAQVRELIDRYRPSVLWNDIAWPSSGKRLWPLFDYYYGQVPDGVVNDRWLPWNPLFALGHLEVGRRAIDALARREMGRDGGLVPPRPPHFDVRTPEYVVFPDVQRRPWECVRGMDESFGYNACSRPEDFIAHDDLLWLLTDIVAKGGNLLLNVGPRGIDGKIPDEQAARLEWLGHWTLLNGEALYGTRPWIRPGTVLSGEHQVRYTAAGDSVFTFLRDPTEVVTLSDVRATPTTTVETLDGKVLPWSGTAAGIEVYLAGVHSGPGALVVALRRVDAMPLAEHLH